MKQWHELGPGITQGYLVGRLADAHWQPAAALRDVIAVAMAKTGRIAPESHQRLSMVGRTGMLNVHRPLSPLGPASSLAAEVRLLPTCDCPACKSLTKPVVGGSEPQYFKRF